MFPYYVDLFEITSNAYLYSRVTSCAKTIPCPLHERLIYPLACSRPPGMLNSIQSQLCDHIRSHPVIGPRRSYHELPIHAHYMGV